MSTGDERHKTNDQHIDVDLSAALAKAVKHQSKDDKFTDVTIDVEGTVFKSHRFILSAMSGFYRGLFASGMKESEEQHVSLCGMSPDTFSLILESIFESKNVLTANNYIQIWKACDMLQVISLMAKCEEFVMNSISVHNCVLIHQLAVQLNSKSVEMFSFNFFLYNFDEICSLNSDFLCLKVEELKSIIKNDCLRTTSENNVIRFILKWVTYTPASNHDSELKSESMIHSNKFLEETVKDIENQTGDEDGCIGQAYPRAQWLTEMLSMCRLLLTSDSFLIDLLNNRLIKSVLKAKQLLEMCVRLKLLRTYRHNMSSVWSIHRMASRSQSAFIYFRDAFNLRAALLKESSNVTFYQSSTCITRFEPLVSAAVVMNDQILALSTEGVLYSKSLYDQSCFEILTKKTNNAKSIIVVNDKLYQVGSHIEAGFIRVHYLVIHSLSLDDSLVDVENLRLASVGDNIVVFGSERETPGVTVVQRLDTHTGRSRRLDDVPGAASGLVTFQTYEDTFFLFSDGALWKLQLCEDTDVLSCHYVTSLWTTQQRIYGALVVNGRLLVYSEGGADQARTEVCDVAVGGAFTSVSLKQLMNGFKCSHFLNANLPSELCNSLKKSKL